MQKQCAQCKQAFEITDDDLKFYEKVSPVFGGKKYVIPPPTLCYTCRLQKRLSWRNDRNLYIRTCDYSGQKLISMFSPEKNRKVYHKDIWWSDKWNALDYGKEFDFSKTFFEQFEELQKAVPYPHTISAYSINSMYTNYSGWNKNCYLCFTGNHLEDSMYCYNVAKSKDCADSFFVYDSELCYECVQSEKCYNTAYALHSKNCTDSFLIEDCTDCKNCFMCCNLKHKEYYILNKKYSKNEYEEIIKKYQLNTTSGLKKVLKDWEAYRLKYPKKAHHNVQIEDSSGEYISECKNCQSSYSMAPNCEDCKYIFNSFPHLKDAMDCTFCGEKASLLYECIASGDNGYELLFCNICINSSNIYYSSLLSNSKNCFGCSGMKDAEYCILNKQYSKNEYEALVPKIIEHMMKTQEWGEFLPMNISPFFYNETIAQDYFPLSQTDAIKKGLQWQKKNISSRFQGEKYQIPDNINDVSTEILKQILVCESCEKNYKIIESELKFYQKKGLPIPTHCFDCRHKKRLAMKNSYHVYTRTCAKCSSSIQTTYSPNQPEIVYCEQCYLQEVY